MANIILFDNEVREHLRPFTFTRPVGEIRMGILTIREKWERMMNAKVSYITQDYLAEKYPLDYGKDNYLINGSVLPSPQLIRILGQMDFNEAYLQGEELIAARLNERQFEKLINDEDFDELRGRDVEDTEFVKINRLWDLFLYNDKALRDDFELLTHGRVSQPISESNQVLAPENVFVEPGAKIECAFINGATGPVYIDRNAEIMEGSAIRGPFYLGPNSEVKMGAKIYGATTIGPYCRVGGEVKNSVFFGYSNKAHEGYLGNSVIAEWCNIGAGTNCSNLKNNYAEVRLWDYTTEKFEPTGQQFCGLFMADHSKCAIGTMFNTGTTVGVCCNVFGSDFPRSFIPSFSWGGHSGFQTFKTEKAFETIEKVFSRRNIDFTIQERLILLRVFEDTAQYRRWEKKD